ncbi:hypothetical protein AURDEDRAFT_113514 [Auricularia subglabra TFB-10046 SS5]|nr:hypothetical protein AURDEDRAFT_113514 [Auricularia subglabra TFB-10046 SS5]
MRDGLASVPGHNLCQFDIQGIDIDLETGTTGLAATGHSPWTRFRDQAQDFSVLRLSDD